MRERIVTRMGIPATVALALAVVALYSLWGMTVLDHERRVQAQPQTSVALGS